MHEIGKKIVEEAAEVWMAAEYQSQGPSGHRDQPAAVPPPGSDAAPLILISKTSTTRL